MSHAIETRGLNYRAGKSFEIGDLNLKVPSGSVYGFLGPNGSGKTTTIRLLLAQLRAKAGTITLLGMPVPARIAQVLARTGYVPERPHLYPSLTVSETMRYHAAFYPGWDARCAGELAAQFRLDLGRQTSRLSKGEMGQLMIMLALAQSPQLLVLDEPTEGLDPVVRRDILAALLDYVSQNSATVFISSHLVHELEGVCDWVGVMDDGRMVIEMPMEMFKSSIKRLGVVGAPEELETPPFALLARESLELGSGVESWVVRGWQAPMKEYFESTGATLREVVDLDLEEGFVELLRTSRSSQP